MFASVPHTVPPCERMALVLSPHKDRGVSLGEGFILRGLERSEDDGLENICDIDVAFEEFQRLQSVSDITEVAIDVSLGVAIPGHEAAKFASKQNSLHVLMVERERSEKRGCICARSKPGKTGRGPLFQASGGGGEGRGRGGGRDSERQVT